MFTNDYPATLSRAIALDQALTGAASQVSSAYVDLVSLAARIAFGSLDITIGHDAQGNVDPTDVKVFMKDIGSSGCVLGRSAV